MSTVACPHCKTEMRPTDEGAIVVRCPSCSGTVFCQGEGPQVIIAHESEALCQRMTAALAEAGIRPIHAADGAEAFRLLEAFRPAAAVLDVGLSRVLTFQIVEYIRRTPALVGTKILLVASVFKKGAYKRHPTSLYGADDYIEQHEIADALAQKLLRLLEQPTARADDRTDERRGLIEASESSSDLLGSLRVRALAHSIVADIALYHQAEFEKAVRGQPAELDDAINDGRRLLEEIVDSNTYAGRDPVGEALSAFIEEMQRATR